MLVLGFSGFGLVASWLWLLLSRLGAADFSFAQGGHCEKGLWGNQHIGKMVPQSSDKNIFLKRLGQEAVTFVLICICAWPAWLASQHFLFPRGVERGKAQAARSTTSRTTSWT